MAEYRSFITIFSIFVLLEGIRQIRNPNAEGTLLKPTITVTQGSLRSTRNTAVECQGSCLSSAACSYYGGSSSGKHSCDGSSICCNFEFSCGTNSSELISTFKSPNYPSSSNQSAHCDYTIYTQKEVCSLRLDFLDLEMSPSIPITSSPKTRCVLDTFMILNNKNQPNEPMCGFHKYSFLVEVDPNTSVTLLFVMQSHSWKWKVRVKQILCNQVQPWKNEENCGRQLLYEQPASHEADTSSSNNNEISSLIVNGVDAEEDEFPWQVSLQFYSGHKCGGSIIDERHILTAAHCVYSLSQSNQFQVKIVPGIMNLKEDVESIEVENVILNYDYKPFMTFLHDIAILKLKQPLLYSAYLQPVCLPLKNDRDDDLFTADESKLAITSGWGNLNGLGEKVDELQKLEMIILNNTECERLILKNFNAYYEEHQQMQEYEIQNTKMCAIALKPNSTLCNGDSGGGLVLVQNKKPFQVTQVGIVSYGIGKCYVENPVIFTKVSEYLKFIEIAVSS